MTLGIYMGSFNPPHKGHLEIVNYLLKNNYVDKVLIVPTLSYWDKDISVCVEDRINMLRFFETDNIIIDDKHNKYIYTYELVMKLRESYPNYELSIIIGADNIINLDKWKNYKELLNYNIIVMNRNNIDIEKYVKKYQGNFTIINDYKGIDISSTELRKKLSSKYLDKRVIEYINNHHLY